MSEQEQKKPRCKLIGTDGNVFSLMSAVRHCLRKHNKEKEANEFLSRAMDAKSYDQVLQIIHDYVEVR